MAVAHHDFEQAQASLVASMLMQPASPLFLLKGTVSLFAVWPLSYYCWRALRRRDTRGGSPLPAAVAAGVAVDLATAARLLPASVRGHIAGCLRLQDFSAWAVANRSMCAAIWDCVDVWQHLAVLCGLSGFLCESPEGARRSFRRAFFRLDGRRLRSLARSEHQQVLQEAARMVSGLMPEDAAGCCGDHDVDLDLLISQGESALNKYDASRASSTAAAEQFVEAAASAMHILGEARIERLEHAFRSSQQLHDLMVSAMGDKLQQQVQEMEEHLCKDFWSSCPSLDQCELSD